MKIAPRQRKQVALYELEGDSNFLALFKNKENARRYTTKGVFRSANNGDGNNGKKQQQVVVTPSKKKGARKAPPVCQPKSSQAKRSPKGAPSGKKSARSVATAQATATVPTPSSASPFALQPSTTSACGPLAAQPAPSAFTFSTATAVQPAPFSFGSAPPPPPPTLVLKAHYPIGAFDPKEETAGWTPLHFAAALGFEAEIRAMIAEATANALIASGTDVNNRNANNSNTTDVSALNNRFTPSVDNLGNTLSFHPAVRNPLTPALLAAMVAEGGWKKSAPLRVAAKYGRLGVVKLLCEHPMLKAADRQSEADFLVTHPGNQVEDYRPSAGRAPNTDGSGGVRTTPSYVVSYNFGIDFGSALFLAASFGHLEVVRYFCEEGAAVFKARGGGGENNSTNPSALTASGAVTPFIFNPHYRRPGDFGTALHIASQSGQLPVVQYLFEVCGVDPFAVRETGASSLFAAALHGRMSVVKYLVEVARVDPTLRTNGSKQTAEEGARKNGFHDVANYLRDAVAQSRSM